MNDPRHKFTKPLPSWFRQPSETYRDWIIRDLADREAEAHRRLNERLAPPKAGGLPIDLATSVGQYDGNGNPKGSGWA